MGARSMTELRTPRMAVTRTGNGSFGGAVMISHAFKIGAARGGASAESHAPDMAAARNDIGGCAMTK